MRNLKQGLMDHTELTKRGRRLLRSGSFFYFILLCLMCFLPQQPEPGMETPDSTFRSYRRPASSS